MTRDEILKLLELESEATQDNWNFSMPFGVRCCFLKNSVSEPVLITTETTRPDGEFIAASRNSFKDLCHMALDSIRYREALEEISLGRGPYSIDPFEHARACIDSMKQTALEALDKKESV